jgi:hypothetical protein
MQRNGRHGASAIPSNEPSATVTLTDASTLTVTVPLVESGLQDLVLINPDGSTYTVENGLAVHGFRGLSQLGTR